MPTEPLGTLEAGKEYIFTTPLDHGFSYKLCNATHPDYDAKIEVGREFVEKAVRKARLELMGSNDLLLKVKELKSDLWLSIDAADKIVGCFTIGIASYPGGIGVFVESLAGEFDFPSLTSTIEDFYRKLNYTFVEIQGRRGWEKIMVPLGYKFANITLIKRLR